MRRNRKRSKGIAMLPCAHFKLIMSQPQLVIHLSPMWNSCSSLCLNCHELRIPDMWHHSSSSFAPTATRRPLLAFYCSSGQSLSTTPWGTVGHIATIGDASMAGNPGQGLCRRIFWWFNASGWTRKIRDINLERHGKCPNSAESCYIMSRFDKLLHRWPRIYNSLDHPSNYGLPFRMTHFMATRAARARDLPHTTSSVGPPSPFRLIDLKVLSNLFKLKM